MPNDDQKRIITAITLKLIQLGHEVSWQEPITTGPLITTFRFMPKNATKVSQICSCAEDLAIALKVEDVLVRRLPGEGSIGVSVPNAQRETVWWKSHLSPPPHTNLLPLNLGVDSQGHDYREDLTKCPHLLIAGSTGGGKSVLMNVIIASLMFWRRPDEVQFALSDTKRLDYPHLEYTPKGHMWAPAANSQYTSWELMDKLQEESERRLSVIGCWRCQNVAQYNEKNPTKLPYILFCIDELATVLGGKRGESKIAQQKLGAIVQTSRATGIHVVAATQRPSVDVIDGTTKNNFPARLSFKLGSQIDSRTVLDEPGAEHLLTQGDMLYSSPCAPGLRRLHSAWAPIEDIEACLLHGVRR